MLIPKTRIYLSSPHMSGREQKYIQEAFDTNWIAPLGQHVDAFEKEIAAYAGVKGAVALSSGTAALHLALRLVGVGSGDVVFCSSLTFVSSANVVLYQGGTPVFIDSEPSTWNMSPAALKRAFFDALKTGRPPKAVMVVNLYGQSADMEPILEICGEFGVPVIEDAAESLGATYRGCKSGSLGKYGVYSFNGNKIITTSGGGMLLGDDLESLEKARFWATQAREPVRHYEHKEVGYNYRLSNVLAGIGRGQLEVLEERVEARRAVFSRYVTALSGVEGIDFMPEADFGRSSRWLTAMTVAPEKCGVTRDEIIDALEKENIEARPVWKPMHLQPLFRGYKYYTHEDERSVSDSLFKQGLCLPSGSNLAEDDQDRVIECIRRCLNEGNSNSY